MNSLKSARSPVRGARARSQSVRGVSFFGWVGEERRKFRGAFFFGGGGRERGKESIERVVINNPKYLNT